MKIKKDIWLPAAAAAAGIIIGLAYTFMTDSGGTVNVVERAEPGSDDIVYELILDAEGVLSGYEYDVTAAGRAFTAEEEHELLVQASELWRTELLGENVGPDRVDKDLSIPGSLCEGAVSVRVAFDDPDVISTMGHINLKNVPDTGKTVAVRAELSCGDSSCEDVMYVRVCPPQLSDEEKLLAGIEYVLYEDSDKSSTEIVLPDEINGVPLTWSSKKDTTGVSIILLGIAAAVALVMAQKQDLKQARLKRNAALEKEYPIMLRQLSLLVGAGMTVRNSFERILNSYDRRAEAGYGGTGEPLYEELRIMLRQMRDGKGEREAYEEFGKRIPVTSYRRLANLLVSNLRRGNANLSKLLEEEVAESYSKQMELSKKQGEELETRLLVPMMILLFLVMVIVMLPAMMSMSAAG